jgi:hypothetical protein
MDEIDVDVIGPKPPQAPFDGGHDVAPGSSHVVDVARGPEVDLARDDDIVPDIPDKPAQDFLGPARLINVGAIEKVDSLVPAEPDDRGGGGFVGFAAEGLRSKAQRGYPDPGISEKLQLHVALPPRRVQVFRIFRIFSA